MKIWLIADTHFNHNKMVELTHRPKNFNHLIISRWNKNIATDDVVFHLGDVILGHDSELSKFLSALNGKKILCRGNHDKKPNTWYMNKGFDFVCDYFVYKDIAFSHAPLTPLPNQGLDKYMEPVRINIHGHFHKSIHRGAHAPDTYFDVDYYTSHIGHYRLIQIEDTFRPVLLDSYLHEAEDKPNDKNTS